jgi:hypothetical protein
MLPDEGNKILGGSVGAIVGFAGGANFTIENCKATGSVKGHDGVAGLVGRCYATATTVTNCTNDAEVYGIRKTAGVVGYISATNGTVTATGAVNNGAITAGGAAADVEKLAETHDHYTSGKIFVLGKGITYGGTKTTTTEGVN